MTNKQKQQFYSWIGTQIANHRTQKGVTQIQLADAIGISRATMINIEKGRQTPTLHAIWIIAKELNVPISFIIPLNLEHSPDQFDNEIDQKIDSTPNLNQDEKTRMKDFLGDLF